MGNSSSSGSHASPSSRSSNDRQGPSRSGTLTGASSNHRSSLVTGGGTHHHVFSTTRHLPSLQLPFGPFRGTGSLGLTKAELDAACQPSGLYPTCEWDTKQIRRLIGDGRLAPRLKGSDSRCTKTDRECPICFMLYSQSNVTKCCEATICTECYLQIKTPKETNTTCPFCNCPKIVVTVQTIMDEDAIAKREEEEQRVIESIIRNRVAQAHGEVPTSPSSEADDGSFGSSLEQYNRSRTFSNGSSAVSEGSGTNASCHSPIKHNSDWNDKDALLSLAMSPDARVQLEEEMAAQLSHEMHHRMESEAEEARMRHVEEWSRSDSGFRSRERETRIAELTSLLERMSHTNNSSTGDDTGRELGAWLPAFDFGGRGSRSSALENLMRLEAAFLDASGQVEGRRRRFRNREDGVNSLSLSSPRRMARALPRRGMSTTHIETAEMLMRGISEEEQLAMAIEMSINEETSRQQQEHVLTEENAPTQGGQEEGNEPERVSAPETNHASSSDSSSIRSSSESTDSDTDEINESGHDTQSLAAEDDDEEEVVIFDTESTS